MFVRVIVEWYLMEEFFLDVEDFGNVLSFNSWLMSLNKIKRLIFLRFFEYLEFL